MLLLLLACCLLSCLLARRASSTLVPNNLINWLKYYVLQLGDPYPYPIWPGCWLVVVVSWQLAAVGGCQLVVAGGWPLAVVGDSRLAVGSCRVGNGGIPLDPGVTGPVLDDFGPFLGHSGPLPVCQGPWRYGPKGPKTAGNGYHMPKMAQKGLFDPPQGSGTTSVNLHSDRFWTHLAWLSVCVGG